MRRVALGGNLRKGGLSLAVTAGPRSLFAAVATLRLAQQWMPDVRTRRALDAAEQFADGLANAKDLVAVVGDAAGRVRTDGRASTPQEYAAWSVLFLSPEPAFDALVFGGNYTADAFVAAARVVGSSVNAMRSERQRVTSLQRAILRDVADNCYFDFALPLSQESCQWCGGTGRWPDASCLCCRCDGRGWFHPPEAVCPWLRWQGGVIPTLAGAMYEGRDFTQAPLLADMLEDAGCTEPAILDHLRGPGPHVRGCWVVDLILGRTWWGM